MHIFNETWAILWLLVVSLVLTASLMLITSFAILKYMYIIFRFCARICCVYFSYFVLPISEHANVLCIRINGDFCNISVDVIQPWRCICNVPIITEMFIIPMICYLCACLIINIWWKCVKHSHYLLMSNETDVNAVKRHCFVWLLCVWSCRLVGCANSVL